MNKLLNKKFVLLFMLAAMTLGMGALNLNGEDTTKNTSAPAGEETVESIFYGYDTYYFRITPKDITIYQMINKCDDSMPEVKQKTPPEFWNNLLSKLDLDILANIIKSKPLEQPHGKDIIKKSLLEAYRVGQSERYVVDTNNREIFVQDISAADKNKLKEFFEAVDAKYTEMRKILPARSSSKKLNCAGGGVGLL